MSDVRIKICGITSLADAQSASSAGADYLGFNFIERSKRYIKPEELLPWWGELPGRVQRVALFQDHSAQSVEQVLGQLSVDVLQFHGAEEPQFCEQFGLPYWKSVSLPVSGSVLGEQFSRVAAAHSGAAALLLDAVTLDRHGVPIAGGTGKQFDWALWPQWASQNLVLAGGLNPSNVGAAVAALRPWCVDVSSGVEVLPGRKDTGLVAEFCANTRAEPAAAKACGWRS